MGDRMGSHGNNWQLKRVNSVTGTVGTFLSDAIRNPVSVTGQTEVLWTSGSGSGRIMEHKAVENFHSSGYYSIIAFIPIA